MRLISSAALWAACACLLVSNSPLHSLTSSTAHADPDSSPRKVRKVGKSKNAKRCVKFQQTLGTDEESVDLRLTSNCKFEVVCSLEWELVCAGENDSQTMSEGKRSRTLEFTDAWEVSASANVCESDWEIKNVKWNCQPAEI